MGQAKTASGPNRAVVPDGAAFAHAGSPAVLYRVAAVLVVVGLVHLGVFALDDRPWAGPVSWRKPFTFGLSFGITLACVTWLTSYLRLPERSRALLLAVFAVDCCVEVAGISVQAWRDQPSHLNTTTPINAAIAYTLAAGGAVLIVVLGRFAALAVAGRVDGPPDLRLAIRAGFALLVVGLLSGAAMIAYGTAILRTQGPEQGYAAAGSLKGLHFVTLHAVLVLPGLAVLLRRRGLGDGSRLMIIRCAVAAYVVAALAVGVWSVARVV